VAIANAFHLEAARRHATPVLFCLIITTPCQVWSRWTYIAAYYSVFAADTFTLRYDLDLWPLTLNICSVSPVTWWNSVPNLNAIELPRRSYCDFN